MELKIKYNNDFYEINFYGFKIFQTKKPNLFLRNFYEDAKNSLYVDCDIFKNNLITVSDFTKVDTFFSFSKSSEFYKKIINFMIDQKFLNEKAIDQTIDFINKLFDFDILENDIDFNKVIVNLLSINGDKYINKKLFLKILSSNLYSEKMTFLFNDIDWIKYDDIKPFLNNHNFIFITNDFRKNISNVSSLESVSLVNNKIFEIYDTDKLISYLEKELNICIDQKILTNFFDDKDDEISLKIYLKLFFLEKFA